MSGELPGGGTGVVDVHAHGVPATVLDLIERRGSRYDYSLSRGEGGVVITVSDGTVLRPLPRAMGDPDARREWMARQGLGVMCVSPWLDIQGYELDASRGRQWATDLNDAMAAGLSEAGGATELWATVHPGDPAGAVAEMLRARDELRAAGMMLSTHFPGGSAADPRLEPLWEAAADREVPVMLHPPITGPASCITGYDDYRSLYGRPLETTFVATRLITDGVMDRYPGLRVVLPHGGGFLPYQRGRLDQQIASGRIAPAAGSERPASDYVRDFYYDTAMMEPRAVAFLRELAPGRVAVGTDYPFTARTEDVPALLDALGDEHAREVGTTSARALLGAREGDRRHAG